MSENSPAMITTLSFDGDNTLWDFEKLMRHSLECVRAELVKHTDPQTMQKLTVDRLIEIRNEVFESKKGAFTKLENIRLEAFKETLNRFQIKDAGLAESLNTTYLNHRFEDLELYPDVLPVLNKLKRKYKIGLLSNGNSYPHKIGLDGLFDFVVFSQDHGVEKPDKRIFKIALKEAGCSADEMVHVGDSLESDIQGAQNAGIQAVWLNREGEVSESEIKPDSIINSLYGLTNYNRISEI